MLIMLRNVHRKEFICIFRQVCDCIVRFSIGLFSWPTQACCTYFGNESAVAAAYAKISTGISMLHCALPHAFE